MFRYQQVKQTLTIFIITGVAAGVLSCSTKKNTMSRRAYHNLTARYNVYFNGKEAFKAGAWSVEQTHKDNFSEIIPMYVSSDKEACAGASGKMDRAIEKASKLIKRHSITAKPKSFGRGAMTEQQRTFYAKKDYCNWVDDAYFLMGKAYLYKHDYSNASKNFTYVMNEFKTAGLRVPAALWLSRTKAEEGETEDAQEVLDKLMSENKFPEEYKPEHAALYANALIKGGKYREAIPQLEEAISLAKKRKSRIRYKFILAQLYQKTNDNKKALDLYAEIIKMGPPYEMAFNAKINLATSFESGNSEQIKKMLMKLLRDPKNKDFQDQIYYALANIAYREGDTDKALELYKMSVARNVSNKYQKSMSFLAIGDIYYDRKKYIDAQPYYDSCVLSINEEYKDYATLAAKSKNLNELAKNYKIVTTEDSLTRMANMNPAERNALIDKAIQTLVAKEQEEQRREQEASLDSRSFNQDFGTKNQKAGSSWYFYNTTIVTQGKSEFFRQWGQRKLEDDWRRKNKAAVAANEEDSTETDSVPDKKAKLSNKSREYYLVDVPATDSAKQASRGRAETALYNMGTIFMNKIEDNGEAINTFEQFCKRYDESEYLVIVYYNLFTLYTMEGKPDDAARYKSLIIQKYPSSKYAQAIMNPNFVRDYKARESKVETVFRKTYKSYFAGDFSDVVQSVAEIEKEYPDCNSMPKFQFLKTLSVGRQSSASEFRKGLSQYVATYPNDEASALAKRIIDFIDDQKASGADINVPVSRLVKDSTSGAPQSIANQPREQKEEEVVYTYQDGGQHYYVVAANTELVKMSRLKFNLINYNLEYFSNFNFEIQEKVLNKKYSMIIVKPLVDNRQGMNYFDLASISDEIFEGVDKASTEHFIISEQNYNILLKDMRLDKYMEFFYQNYIK